MKFDIGARIKEMRYKFNMSQKTLSELLEIPQSKLSKMENNELSYDMVHLILNICSIFKISVSEFFDENICYKNCNSCINNLQLSDKQVSKLIEFIESLKNSDNK